MRKIGRNDPCPCGSGKKYKHCCGATNAQVETNEQINEELYQVHQNLTSFVRDKNGYSIEEQYARFGQKYEMSEDARKIHLTGLIPWITTSAPVFDKGQTLFERFLQTNQRRMRPRVRNMVEQWQEIAPAVYEVMSTDVDETDYIVIQRLNSHDTYHILYKENNDIAVGNILIGILVPFVDHHEFMISMVKLVDVDQEKYKAIIQQHEESNEAFPGLLAAILTQRSNQEDEEPVSEQEPEADAEPETEVEKVSEDSVEGLLTKHLTAAGISQDTIEKSLMTWKTFYDKENPTIMKMEPYAAAMEYYTRKDMLEDESATQSKIAKSYGTSSSSLSKNYRRIVGAL